MGWVVFDPRILPVVHLLLDIIKMLTALKCWPFLCIAHSPPKNPSHLTLLHLPAALPLDLSTGFSICSTLFVFVINITISISLVCIRVLLLPVYLCFVLHSLFLYDVKENSQHTDSRNNRISQTTHIRTPRSCVWVVVASVDPHHLDLLLDLGMRFLMMLNDENRENNAMVDCSYCI